MAEETEKLKFKTQEDRKKAIEDLGEPDDVPVGKSVDEYNKEYGERLDQLMDAEIDPNMEETPAETPPGETPTETPPEPPPEPPPTEPDPVAQATAPLEHRINEMQTERESMIRENNQKMQDMEKKIEDLQKQREEPPKPEEKVEPDKYENEIADVNKEIKRLEEEMNGIEESEYEKKAELSVKIVQQNTRLSGLINDRTLEMKKAHQAEMAKIQDENKKREEEAARRAEQEKAREASRKNRTAMITMAEDFRKVHPEFQGKKSYEEMELDHYNFSKRVAARYFGIREDKVTGPQREVAMKRWEENTPALMEKVKDIKVPEELDKFMLLSDVQLAQQGLAVDPYSGEYVQKQDISGQKVVLPDLETAYDVVKKQKGITAEELAKLQKTTAEEVKKAMEQRTDPREIDDSHQKGSMEEMTKEEAIKLVNSYDEEAYEIMARQAVAAGKELPQKVQLINQALVICNLDPITGQ